MSDSPIKWMGSKRKMAQTIIKMFPFHKIYVEPFFGGGSVFFAKYPSQVEIINDINDLLINFFRVVQTRLDDLIARFEFALHSRKVFEEYSATDWTQITDPVEKAFRFYYLIRNAYCGLYRTNQNGKFNAPFGGGTNSVETDGIRNLAGQFFNFSVIKKAHKRLKRTTIECLDYKTIIEKYDAPHTLFFLDPPYATDYDYGTGKFNYTEFKEILESMEGTWIITLNAQLAPLFKGYKITRFDKARRRVDKDDRASFIADIIVKCKKITHVQKRLLY